MNKQFFILSIYCLLSISSWAQTITIVGSGVNGWPPTTGPEISLATTDNQIYTVNHLTLTDGVVKFRQDFSWTINWGGSTFPSGQGVQDGSNIPTTAGTYDVTLNRTNGTYTFIPSSSFPSIGIWGPAVNSQLGYVGPDVDMNTTDGITYTLSGFYFSSGNAYFRQDNATNFVWGSVAFPTGTAQLNGPTIFVTGGEWFVTFNRLTGTYSFTYPSIGILGTALNGFDTNDTDLETTNGWDYTLPVINLLTGEVKFRKDNSWTTNWGANAFPSGTGTQDGPNIPINSDSVYSIQFNRSTGAYVFTDIGLGTNSFSGTATCQAYPNPTSNSWNLVSQNNIEQVVLSNELGQILSISYPKTKSTSINASMLPQGIYWAKLSNGAQLVTLKLIKN
jgi:hypothetical protein